HATHAVDVGKIQLGVDAVGIEVERQVHQIHVAGALAIAKQAAFHAVGTGQQAQLAGGHAGTTVLVGVQANYNFVAIINVAAEVCNLVGIHIGHGHFHGGRQVENQLVGVGGLDYLADRIAHLDGKLRLGGAKGFRRIFKAPVGIRLLGSVFFQQLCSMYGQGFGAVLVLLED